jgi:hypothetical protein
MTLENEEEEAEDASSVVLACNYIDAIVEVSEQADLLYGV